MNNTFDRKICKDIWRFVGVSGLVVLSFLGIMFFSPLSSQFTEYGVIRGSSFLEEVDEMISSNQYSRALATVDSIIANDRKDLPGFTYFDRFLSEQKRYDTSVLRAEIYELRWRRIEILKAKNDIEKLKEELKSYSRIPGYRQNDAKKMLNQLNGR